jgi:hypothetical protein
LKTLTALLLAALISVYSSNASARDKDYSPPAVFDGRTWQALTRIDAEWSPIFKTCIVRGIYEGAYAVNPQNAYEQYGPWASCRELVSSIDRFYSEHRNLSIPVAQALILLAADPSGRINPAAPAVRRAQIKSGGGSLVSMEQPGESSDMELAQIN